MTAGRIRLPRKTFDLRGATWQIEALVLVLGLAGGLLAGLLLMPLAGVSPLEALTTLIDGSVGSTRAIGDSLTFATPRLLVALGAAVAIRSGVFNLGGEGQLQLGAAGAAVVALLPLTVLGPLHLVLAVIAGAVCGALWAAIAAVLKVWRGIDEVISTLMLSFVAVYLIQYLVQGPLQPEDAVANTSDRIHSSAELPNILPGARLHAGFLMALVAVVGTLYLLNRTRLGLRLRATGLNPAAARVQGIGVKGMVIISMLISGALGGLAGVAEILGVQFRLLDDFSAQIGFEGLAIAFLGGLNPVGILFVSVYFGMVRAGALDLELALGVPSSVAFIIEALPIVFLAAARGWLVATGRVRQ